MYKTKGLEYLKKEFCDDSDRPSPMVFRHVKRLIFIMSTIGSWPHNISGRPRLHNFLSTYSFILIIVAVMFSGLAGGYLKQHWDEMTFFDMGHIILTICLNGIYMTRLMQARAKKVSEAIRDCFLEFHLYYYKDRSAYWTKIFSEIHIISGIFTIYILILMMVGMSLFTLKPLYTNYSKGMFSSNPPPNGTFEHSVYFYFPTDVFYTTLKGHWILFAINLPNNYNVTCGVFGFDLLLILAVLQIYGHIKIMKHNLLSIPLPKKESDIMFSAEENRQVAQLLKDIIIHHNLIIKFVDKFSDAFQEYLFLFYFFLQIISCVLLMEVSTLNPEALAMYGPLTLGMFQQLMLLSIMFEILNSKSEELEQVVYAIPWEFMDGRNRKSVLFMLYKVQTPISLKAGGMVPVGVKTMSSILRTSLSYYMVLMALAREQ
uniref:Odorant receptor n=1 Tax=Hedya nubiferana TaxID=572853 RepID=A0A223HCZ3_9NEOP|nr:putative odorant receptor OR2.1 [Hedya nubiferana]